MSPGLSNTAPNEWLERIAELTPLMDGTRTLGRRVAGNALPGKENCTNSLRSPASS